MPLLQGPSSMLPTSAGRTLVPLHFQSLQMGQGSGPPPPQQMMLRHSASAADLSRAGGMHGGGQAMMSAYGGPMYGLGAPMGPLAEMGHVGSPRAPQVSLL